MAPQRDENRYKPRHAWYLADAQLLIRKLQQACWPLFHHVALGGGVLNHGYSDKDLDIYVLPNYKPGVVHETLQEDLTRAISRVFGANPVHDMNGERSPGHAPEDHVDCGHNADWVQGGCFAQALRYEDTKGRTVDVFVVKA